MQATINRIAFLDFDGVLFNTVREAYAISIIATGRSNGIKEVDFNSNFFKKFNYFRYLIGPAWHYYYLLKAIDKAIIDSNVNIERKFKEVLKESTRGSHLAFEKLFFQTREKLRNSHREQWLMLISPYKIVEDLRILIDEFREQIFLITTRDRESVLDILNSNSLHISNSNIFAKKEFELHTSKANILKGLIDKYQIESAIFIDDLEENLMACKTIENILTFQATWGYVEPERKEDNSIFLLKKLGRFMHGENVWA
jgi:hypothetical protein